MHTFLWYPGPPTDQGFKSSNNKSNDSSSSNNINSIIIITITARINMIVVAQLLSCLTHCNPMDCNTSGFPILHYLLEFVQTHVH